jgi:aspartate/methionine/tyrosine aminotransferase
MLYHRMPIERESPEETGQERISINLAESSVADLKFSDLQLHLDQLSLGYSDHRGKRDLRALLAQHYGVLDIDQVLLTQGAAGALFIVQTAILNSRDHLIVLRPNYASNIEVPRAMGCSVSYVDLQMDRGWKPDIEQIGSLVGPATRLISITAPQSPTGIQWDQTQLSALVRLVEGHGILLLVDETYRDICSKTAYPLVATTSSQVISISSVSKAFGVPGLRMGWLATRNRRLMEQFLAAKEMIHITNSVLDEEIVYQILMEREKWTTRINSKAIANFEILRSWLSREARLECVLPQAGVVCLARINAGVKVDLSGFYALLLQKYQTMVGPGHWFELPDNYMRIGFGWVSTQALEAGLQNISLALDQSVKG